MILKVLIGAGLLAGALVTAVSLLAARREAATEASWPPVGQLIEVDGRQVHALVMGDGPDLVLLHGAGGNLRDFTFEMADALKDRYRVILFDRPGLGYSDRLPGYDSLWTRNAETPQEQAALLAKAAQKLDVQNPIVLGHSFGGAVALAWALDHDAAALVLLSSVSQPWPGSLSKTYSLLGSRLGGSVVPTLVSALISDAGINTTLEGIFAPQDVPEGYANHIGARLSVRQDVLRANARQVLGLRPEIVEMSKRYHELTLPVELFHGDADSIVPLEVHSQPMSRTLPDATLTVLPGVGHMPHHVAQPEILDAIDRIAIKAGLRRQP